MASRFALVWLLALGVGSAAAQQPSSSAPLPLDPAVTYGRLPNGLTYYIRENHRPAKRAELRLVVNAGSVLEDPDQRGLAHFVEHMAFNGTRRFKKQALVDYIEAIGMRFGADLNAGTSFDETIYQLQVPTDSAHLLRRGVEILEDWAAGVTFDTAEVRKERGVVIEEWRLGQGAGMRMLNQQLPVLFRGSRYAERLPIGTKTSLETFQPAALVRFYRDWYRPDLMAVIAVGDFDKRVVERLIRAEFGAIPARQHPRPRPVYGVPSRDSAAVAAATDKEATGTSISVYFLKPASDQRTEAAYRRSLVGDLYTRMLNDRLYELSQKPNPPFIGAGAGFGQLVRSADVFSLGASVADSGITRGFESTLTEVERVDRYGFTPAELDRAKQDLLRGLEQSYAERDKTESSGFVEEYVAHFLSATPSPGIAYEFALAQRLVPSISVTDVNGLARSWLELKDRVLLVNAPAKDAGAIPASPALLALFDQAKQTSVEPYRETVSDAPLVSESLAPAPITAERTDSVIGVTWWTLANGVRVILKPTDFKADEILVSAFSPGGNSLVPDSLFTAATFATTVANLGGLGAFSAIDLQKKLAGKAVQVGPLISSYQEGVRGSASPKDLETLFQLLYLQFVGARADTGAFEAFKSNLHAAVANRAVSPAVAFQDTLRAVLTSHHPRSRPITVAVVDSLNLGSALRVYRDRFADASDFTFVFVGAFRLDSIRPLIQRYLGNLPALHRDEKWRDLGLKPPAGVVEQEVHKGVEPKAQTEIVFSGPFRFSRENRFLLSSLADILEIKLREELREELSGTYGVNVSASPSRVPEEVYSFSIDFGSAPERANELAKVVFQEIDSLRRFGAAAKELEKVRESRIRSRETELKENGFWLSYLSAADQNGDDARLILDQASLLNRLTSEAIRQAAAQYLDPARFVRVTLLPENKPATP